MEPDDDGIDPLWRHVGPGHDTTGRGDGLDHSGPTSHQNRLAFAHQAARGHRRGDDVSSGRNSGRGQLGLGIGNGQSAEVGDEQNPVPCRAKPGHGFSRSGYGLGPNPNNTVEVKNPCHRAAAYRVHVLGSAKRKV